MRILGLPVESFIYELVIPGVILGAMFYYCHLVRIGKLK